MSEAVPAPADGVVTPVLVLLSEGELSKSHCPISAAWTGAIIVAARSKRRQKRVVFMRFLSSIFLLGSSKLETVAVKFASKKMRDFVNGSVTAGARHLCRFIAPMWKG